MCIIQLLNKVVPKDLILKTWKRSYNTRGRKGKIILKLSGKKIPTPIIIIIIIIRPVKHSC